MKSVRLSVRRRLAQSVGAHALLLLSVAIHAEQIRETPVNGVSNRTAVSAAPLAPTVMRVEPSALNPGRTYTLSLTGSNFAAAMQVDFGAGITVARPLTLGDSAHATITIGVAPGAPAGRRLLGVTLVRAATLAAMPPLKSVGPGFVEVSAAPGKGPLLLREVIPAQVRQGQQTLLTLRGSGFQSGMSVSFGPGISMNGSVQVQNDSTATLSVQVAAQAPAILRHPSLLFTGRDTEVSSDATLSVTAGASAPTPTPSPVSVPSVPMVLAVTPSRLFTGQSYTLTLRGVNLVPQLQVDLGPGVLASGGLRIQSPSLATLPVTVAGNAGTGLRWLALDIPSTPAPLRQNASVLIQQSAPASHGVTPVLGHCGTPPVPHQGNIALDGPLYTGLVSDVGGTFNIPVLNDQTVFTWHEANLGLADRVELRFYSGSTLVYTHSFSASAGKSLPHSLSPDPAMIAALTSKVGARVGKVVNQHTTGGATPALAWDLTWQVVGFHTYFDSCVSGAAALDPKSLGAGHEVQVEASEAVPISQAKNGDPLLDLPAAPTGLACGSPNGSKVFTRIGAPAPAAPPSNLIAVNTTRASQGSALATADYVGDQWVYKGSFDLSNSPWALQSQQSVNTSHSNFPIESESLNNVFIDWGDGTVEPLTVQWQGQYCGNQPCFASNTETSSATAFTLDSAMNPSAFGHAYRQVNSFTARVYMLPSAAAQQGALSVSMSAGAGGLYRGLLSATGHSFGGSSAQDEAYMLACQTIIIQHRSDDVSNGKLQLVDVRVTGFPGDESAGQSHGIVKNAKLTPAPAPIAFKSIAPKSAAPKSIVGLRGAGAGVPQFSSCDVNLIGGATLGYYGQGSAKITWYQDGKAVGSSVEPIAPSPPRSDAELGAKPPAAPHEGSWPGLHSPPLNLAQAQIGMHQLQVSAEVVADTHPIGHVMQLLGAAAAHGGTGSGAGGVAGSVAGGVVSSSALAGAPPMGLLGPRGAATAGLAPIAWVGQAPAGALGTSLHLGVDRGPPPAELTSAPPERVVSAAAPYQTTAANPALACTFNFPVQGGNFVIAGLQKGGKATIETHNGHVSGSGVLQAEFVDDSGTSTQAEPVNLQFKDWTLQPDGVTVASGSFDETPSASPMHLPGVDATLVKLSGTAGQSVTATLNATLANADIWSAGGSAPAPWNNVAATLTPAGDWYADHLPVPKLLVYDSGFSLQAASATLDFSQADGQGADPLCQGGGGKAWSGVLLNQASLTAFNFDLPNPPSQSVNGWALNTAGFCGKASFSAGSASLDQGSIGWSGITASAAQGSFSAQYSGLKVHVPWLNVDLNSAQATTQLTAGHGATQGSINLNLTNPTKASVTEGPITLTANNLSFTSAKAAGGWAVKSDSTFSFSSPQGKFADNIVLNGVLYGMDGVAYFADGSSARHLNLSGQKGNIGGALVDLKSLDVQLGAPSSPSRMTFAFDSTLTLSKTLPAADVAVSYNINEPSAGHYGGSGPTTTPFTLEKPFPDANPSVHLKMTPTYVGPGGGNSKTGSGVLFSSALDLGMFGGPPVSGQFVLGYVGSDDYWLAKAVLDLGPTGVQIVPPVINLYQVGGGMGYNVTLDSFKNSDLTKATPQDDGTLLFDATLLVGSPDHTTFGLSGDFVIKPGGSDPGGRMDYHAWLLNPNWSGQSPIYGYFSYTGGVFDGTLNAQLSLLDDQIGLNATHDAIHMHIGGGQWYYHIGTQSNPIDGHLFFAQGKAWADLGSDGFMLGLMANLDLNAGDCGDVCAYLHDDWMLSAGITPSPLSVSASAQENFSVGACAGGLCLSGGASAGVNLSLPPPYLNFTFSLGSCPPGHLDVGLQALPSLNPSIGGGACL